MSALAEVSEFPLRNNRTDDETDSVFLLSRRQTSIRTSGVVEEFDSAFDAAEALKTGRIDSVVGALPFSPETPSALTAPLSFTRVRGDLYHSNIPSLPTSRVAGFEPSPQIHTDRVRGAIERLRAGELDKVVLARSLTIETESTIFPRRSGRETDCTRSRAQRFLRRPVPRRRKVPRAFAGRFDARGSDRKARRRRHLPPAGGLDCTPPEFGSGRGECRATPRVDQRSRRTRVCRRLHQRDTRTTVHVLQCTQRTGNPSDTATVASRDQDRRCPDRPEPDLARTRNGAASDSRCLRHTDGRRTRAHHRNRSRSWVLCRCRGLVRPDWRRRVDGCYSLRRDRSRRPLGAGLRRRRHRRYFRPGNRIERDQYKIPHATQCVRPR